MSKNLRGAINPITGLTEKEQQFALAYVANQGNLSQASKQIGLSRVTCTAYMKKQRVLDYIEALGESAGEKVASATEVLEYFTSVMRGEIKHQVLNIQGEVVEVADLHARNKGAEILSKCYGMQKDVIKNEQTVFLIGGNDYFDNAEAERERKVVDIEMDYLLTEGDKEGDKE